MRVRLPSGDAVDGDRSDAMDTPSTSLRALSREIAEQSQEALP